MSVSVLNILQILSHFIFIITHKVEAIIMPILQMRKLRYRDINTHHVPTPTFLKSYNGFMLMCCSAIIYFLLDIHIRTYRSTSTFHYHIPFYSAIVHNLFNLAPVNEHLGCFRFFIIKNKTAMYMLLQLPTWRCASMV